MTLLSKVGKWGKKKIGKIAAVALPVAALGASLLPGVGGTISTAIGKVGDKIKGSKVFTAVAKTSKEVAPEQKKGFLGLFTGKAKAKKALEKRTENEKIYSAEDEADLDRLRTAGKLPTVETRSFPSLSPPAPDAEKGVSPLAIAAGIGLVLLLTK